jgi:hypothetical protein
MASSGVFFRRASTFGAPGEALAAVLAVVGL